MSTKILSQTALDFLVDLLKNQLLEPINDTYVSYTVDPINSLLKIDALETGKDGTAGIYYNNTTVGYLKANLNIVAPYPFTYSSDYPCTFSQLKLFFQNNYNIVLEENEFKVVNSTSDELTNSSLINVEPDEKGLVKLEATVNSGRWIIGSVFKFIPICSSLPINLNQLIVNSKPLDLNNLVKILNT